MNRNSRNAKAIAELLQSQGFDEIIVALGKDDSMGTAIKGKNENTPHILYNLFNVIESKSMKLAMKAEDNEKKLADAFGELLDFIQTTDTKLNKTLSELEESK